MEVSEAKALALRTYEVKILPQGSFGLKAETKANVKRLSLGVQAKQKCKVNHVAYCTRS